MAAVTATHALLVAAVELWVRDDVVAATHALMVAAVAKDTGVRIQERCLHPQFVGNICGSLPLKIFEVINPLHPMRPATTVAARAGYDEAVALMHFNAVHDRAANMLDEDPHHGGQIPGAGEWDLAVF